MAPNTCLVASLALAGLFGGIRGELPTAQDPATWDPRQPGPFAVPKPVRFRPCSSGRAETWSVLVQVPDVEWNLPVLAWVNGFSATAEMYSLFHSHIASHGFAVVGLDIPQTRTTVEGADARAEDVAALVQCITQNGGADFAAKFRAAGGDAKASFDVAEQFGLIAHSAGGHAALHMLDRIGCFRARFAALLDPVDGLDPFGLEKGFLLPVGVHPEVKLNFTTPVALIISGHASEAPHYPKALRWPACAPADRAGMHWYASLDSPKWLVNFSDFGHADLLNEAIPHVFSDHICASGPGASTSAGREAYRIGLAAIVVALGQAMLPSVPQAPKLAQADFLRWLEQPATALARLNISGVSAAGPAPVAGVCSRCCTAATATVGLPWSDISTNAFMV